MQKTPSPWFLEREVIGSGSWGGGIFFLFEKKKLRLLNLWPQSKIGIEIMYWFGELIVLVYIVANCVIISSNLANLLHDKESNC